MAASPLGAARARRRLTVEEAAARADLDPEAVKSLEENRVYRFESPGAALAAALVYATALGISRREARQLAGLPVRPRFLEPLSLGRLLAAIGFACALAALGWFALVPRLSPEPVAVTVHPPESPAPRPAATPALPDPSEIRVDVYDGTREGTAAARTADEIAALGYRVGTVAKAASSNHAETRVYYPPGAEAIAERLAARLGVKTAALPGGDDPRRLVVIVGAGRAP